MTERLSPCGASLGRMGHTWEKRTIRRRPAKKMGVE
jgi:hypothetical protein